ncbi:hypothetical protein VPAG_00015 [Vibrio phage douglas 12A4]|uniref:hypothetical protein n=1 Tax=Vibrio phage douglas 12A4 TaxID=573171 RepID=UPI0002C10FEA|nr:hypothetical protein VPAG_00015 [Vibrio phage douglas 12A4]AGG58051.1 hypothetical protein VPAG_00015 [Vibrio phage douglas 12A4]
MHPVRLLLKTMSKSIPLNGTFGGTAVFTTSDAAWSLAGLDSYTVTFAYWRYCGDEAQLPKIRELLIKLAKQYAVDKRTKLKESTVISLVDAAIVQYVKPICTVCDGKAIVKDDAGADDKPCKSCKGHGKKKQTKSEIARIANVNRKAITITHLNIIDNIVDVLNLWERKVMYNVIDKID